MHKRIHLYKPESLSFHNRKKKKRIVKLLKSLQKEIKEIKWKTLTTIYFTKI